MPILVLAVAAFLSLAQFAHAQGTIFRVRHAEKAPAAEGDKNPPLSPTGRARAEALAAILRDAGITAIYATEFQRTQQTAEPLARALNLSVTVVPAADTAGLVAKLKDAHGQSLVVGHSNTIPDVLKALGAEGSYGIADDEYDNLFVWSGGDKSQLIRLRLPVPAKSPPPSP